MLVGYLLVIVMHSMSGTFYNSVDTLLKIKYRDFLSVTVPPQHSYSHFINKSHAKSFDLSQISVVNYFLL